MTKRIENPIPKASYRYLLDDPDFRRWYHNVARGTVVTAAVWLRRMGFIHKNFGKTPKDLAKMSSKEAANFILDVVSQMEKDGKLGGYISSVMRPLKSCFAWNEIPVLQKIKVRGQDASTVSEERPPTSDELRMILHASDLRAKASVALMASWCSVRTRSGSDFLSSRSRCEVISSATT